MTALFKFGDTIYQRTVKLNVRSLTEPLACRQLGTPAAESAEGVTRYGCRGVEQRMQSRLVQVPCTGTERLRTRTV